MRIPTARAHGLLTDQQEWSDCLDQAATYQYLHALRHLFAIILVFCHPENPHALWLGHRNNMSEDFLHGARQDLNHPNLQFTDAIYNQALLDIESVLIPLSRSLREFDGFVVTEPAHNDANTEEPLLISSIIIWDEASMISRDVIETVNRSTQDIMRSVDPALEDIPFGGKVVVFGGDFRQVLPVIPNAERPQIVAQCLNWSSIWRHTEAHHLHTNMRVQQAVNTVDGTELREFAEYLLRIGNGSEPLVPGTEDRILINPCMLMPRYNTYDLIDAVFGDLHSPNVNIEFLTNRAILTPKNVDVVELNNLILDQFPGEIQEFRSADQVDDPEDQIRYLTELLNSFNPSDLPPHTLKLKVGCPIMLLRNLNTAQGLCNGTRLIVRSFRRYVLEAEIATGPHTGTIVLIPRITLTPSQSRSPIQFKRTQFPIRLTFSMTINKSQ
ncbi:hypothetical protein INT45_011895, partial [Circinella minor]